MRTIRLILSLIVIVATAAGAAAQPPRPPGAAVSGVVVDVTGAVLPNAQIDLKTATGTTVQSTVADERGTFRIDRVSPGRYDIRATFDGFEPTAVHITVGNRALAPVRVVMPIAGIREEITVGGAAAEISKDAAPSVDASTGDQKGIENLPVFNQDVLATMSRFLDASSHRRVQRLEPRERRQLHRHTQLAVLRACRRGPVATPVATLGPDAFLNRAGVIRVEPARLRVLA